jgi:SAM-dependent methyltransferase
MNDQLADLRDRFYAVDPWFTRYELNGVRVGRPAWRRDYRVALFFEWLGEPARILELGSYQGAHSLRLGEPPFVDEVIGLEGRPDNIAQARVAADLLGRGNITFVHADLDDGGLSLDPFGRFDAVFCAGLLYHLTRPWRLVEKIARVTDRLFLDTHFSYRAELDIDGYEGSLFHEGDLANPVAGLSDASFWMTLRCLFATLERAGFRIIHDSVYPAWRYGPRIHVAAIKP